MKTDLDRYPLGHGLTGFHRRFKLDLTGGTDRIFGETVRKSFHDFDAIELPVGEQEELESYEALDTGAARFACVWWLPQLNDFGLRVNFFVGESYDFGFFQQVGQGAVVSAAIIVVLFSSHQRLRRQR